MAAIIAIALGCALGVMAGGSLASLRSLRLKHEWVILTAFFAQGLARGRIAGSKPSSLGFGVWAVTSTLLMFVLLFEWRRPGVLLAWAGVGFNLVTVLANRGMPVTLPTGLDSATASISLSRTFGFYVLAGRTTFGAVWGDLIVAKHGNAVLLFSAGDVLLVVGVVTIIASTCLSQVNGESAERLAPSCR